MGTRAPVYDDERRIAAGLRHRAFALERCASVDRFYGLEDHAARERRVAARLRELAALSECAPVEVEGATGAERLARAAWTQGAASPSEPQATPRLGGGR